MIYTVSFWFLLCIIVIQWATKTGKKSPHSKKKESNRDFTESQPITQEDYSNYIHAYQRKWLFSTNEKAFYYKLKQFSDKHELVVFSKVRLLDLIEPRQNQKKYKTYFYKIQAKHVDFVLCSQNLVAKYIIELDDASHNATERKERDAFVDTVLTSCGYRVLHMRAFDPEALEKLIQGNN